MFSRYMSRVLRLKILKTNSLTFLSLLFLPNLYLSNFLNLSFYCFPPPFHSHFSPPPSSSCLATSWIFTGLFVSSSLYSAIVWSWRKIFGGVSIIQVSHSTLNMADNRWEVSLMQRWLLHWHNHILDWAHSSKRFIGLLIFGPSSHSSLHRCTLTP